VFIQLTVWPKVRSGFLAAERGRKNLDMTFYSIFLKLGLSFSRESPKNPGNFQKSGKVVPLKSTGG
jgi:hypothetical protein